MHRAVKALMSQRVLLPAVLVALLSAMAVWLGQESVPTEEPGAPRGALYDRVRLGMTESEVEAALQGPCDWACADEGNEPVVCSGYVRWSRSWEPVWLRFGEDGRVNNKRRETP